MGHVPIFGCDLGYRTDSGQTCSSTLFVNIDRPNVQDQLQVERLQHTYVEALHAYVSIHHPHVSLP